MNILLNYLYFIILITSIEDIYSVTKIESKCPINKSKNIESENSKDYDYQNNPPSHKDIVAIFDQNLKSICYELDTHIEKSDKKIEEITHENIKLKKIIEKTEENLNNSLKKIEEKLNETKKVLEMTEIDLKHSKKHLKTIEQEEKEMKQFLKEAKDDIINLGDVLKRMEEEQKEKNQIVKRTVDELKETKEELDETRKELEEVVFKIFIPENEKFDVRITKSEVNLKNLEESFKIIREERNELKEILMKTKNDLKETLKRFELNKILYKHIQQISLNYVNSTLEEIRESQNGIQKLNSTFDTYVTKDFLEIKEDQEGNKEKLNTMEENLEISNYVINKDIYLYQLFNDVNGKNKAFIMPMNATKSQHIFEGAVNLCKHFNSTLIEVETKEKQIILDSFLGRIKLERNFWINGERDSSGKWKWLKSNTQFNFTNWGTNNPILNYDYNNIFVTTFGKWLNTRKNDFKRVICERSFEF